MFYVPSLMSNYNSTAQSHPSSYYPSHQNAFSSDVQEQSQHLPQTSANTSTPTSTTYLDPCKYDENDVYSYYRVSTPASRYSQMNPTNTSSTGSLTAEANVLCANKVIHKFVHFQCEEHRCRHEEQHRSEFNTFLPSSLSCVEKLGGNASTAGDIEKQYNTTSELPLHFIRRSSSMMVRKKQQHERCILPHDEENFISKTKNRLIHRSVSNNTDKTFSSYLEDDDDGDRIDEHGAVHENGNGHQIEQLWTVMKQSPCRSTKPNPAFQRIVINVSGMLFETRLGVLEFHPRTLLGDPKKRSQHYDKKRNEYFFDRHRPTFEAIFHYYQYGGRLKRPMYVPDDIFLTELEFYQIEQEVVNDYKKDEGYLVDPIILPDNKWKKQLWILFEYPQTSSPALIIAIISVIFTIGSIVLLCVETMEPFKETHCVSDDTPNFRDPIFIIESVCTAWFTIEVLVRFISCPSKKSYCKDFKNVIDILAILPYYFTLINVLIKYSCKSAKGSASLAFLRVIRLIRLFKLTKHSSGLQVLVYTFWASLEGLSLFLVALIVCMLVFSSTLYYAEMGTENSQIESIPDAFWWAIITMCTVGYGDCVPKGDLGKLVGSVCAIAGVLTLAIPVPIITENFNKFYTHKTGRGRQ